MTCAFDEKDVDKPESSPALLEVVDLDVAYGRGSNEFRAVKGACLSVAAGEIVGLLGPSGSGKSTLLRAVAGLEAPRAGQVLLDGADITRVPVHKRGIGMVFQDGQLFPHRNVAGNIAYGLEVAHVERKERERRVDEMLELVGLAGYGQRRIDQLSGGQAQRVALARSLAPAPRLLLLDEPLSALDTALRMRLAADVRSIIVSAGAAALYVTHDEAEARLAADRIVRIDEGVIA